MKKNAIFVDFDVNDNWGFIKGINLVSKEKYCVEKCISNSKHKYFFQRFIRYYKYFSFSFKKFLCRKKYSSIISWQQFYGLFLAFFLVIFNRKNGPQITILNFIYKKKKGIIGKVYYHFVKCALKYKNINKICVLSSNEIPYYESIFCFLNRKFVFCKIGIDDKSEYEIEAKKGDYFVSAGRSNRDYNFLIDVFSKTKEKLYILSDTYKRNDLPKNILIFDNCFNEDYERMVANSLAAVISLDDVPISSGQLFALNAFKYKKPVIATRHPGINDYISDGIDGFLVNKNIDEFIIALKKLRDPNIYNSLCTNAKKYTSIDYGKSVAQVINENITKD